MILLVVFVLLSLVATDAIARDCNRASCVMCAVRFGPPAGYEIYRGGRGGESYGGWRMRPATGVTPAFVSSDAVGAPFPPQITPILSESIQTAYTPTPMDVVDIALDLLDLKSSDVLYSPGCGDARELIRASQKYGVSGVGMELNPSTYRIAAKAVNDAGLSDRVFIYEGDATRYTVDEATAVYLYHYKDTLRKLVPVIKGMQPGVKIISYEHDMPELETTKRIIGGHRFFIHITR